MDETLEDKEKNCIITEKQEDKINIKLGWLI